MPRSEAHQVLDAHLASDPRTPEARSPPAQESAAERVRQHHDSPVNVRVVDVIVGDETG